MTREDAIKIFNTLLLFGKCDLRKEEAEKCFKMAIKALEEQSSEDCISRKFMHDMGATCIATRNENGDLVALGALDILPSATPQPKTGHWIEHKHDEIEHIECSKCRCWFLRKNLIRNSYCPNCGSYNGGTK